MKRETTKKICDLMTDLSLNKVSLPDAIDIIMKLEEEEECYHDRAERRER